MKVKICDVNGEAVNKLPHLTADKSGIGVHYIDAFIKPVNVTLPDGTAVTCKRKGLKVLLSFGERKGEGLMRRVERGPDPEEMLQAALEEASRSAGLRYSVEGGAIYLEEA